MSSSLSSDIDKSQPMNSSSPSLPSQRAIVTTILVYNIVIVTISVFELSRREQSFTDILIFVALMIVANGIMPLLFLSRLFKSQHLQTEQVHASNLRLSEEIESRKQIEEALVQNQQQFQAIFDNAQDAILLINQDSRYIGANPAASALLGYSYDEFLQLHPGDIAPAYSDRSKREAMMQEFVSRKTPSTPIRIEMRHKNGQLIPVEILSVPNILPNVHLGIVRDVGYRIEVEKALQASEERHRKVSELISDYAFLMLRNEDGTLRREWLTDSFYKMSGYEKGDPYQETGNLKLTHPDDIKQVRLDHERTLQGETTTTDCRFRIKSGEYIWLRVKREPIWDTEHQEVIGYYGAAHNITTEKEALLALSLSEERYRKATELMSDYSFSVMVNPDKSLELEWITPSHQRIMGFSENEIAESLSLEARMHPDDLERANINFEQVLAGKTVSSEYRSRKKSGEYVWLQTLRQPEQDESGRVIRYYGTSRDITAQKEALLALSLSEERYRKTTQLISDYSFSVKINPDSSLELEWVTPSFQRIMGYTEEDVAKDVRVEARTHPDDIKQTELDLQKVLAGESVTSVFRSRQANGNYIWLEIFRQPEFDEERRVIRYYGAGRDITAQKEAEIALRESETRYRKVAEIISDYAFAIRVNEDKSLKLDWITPSFYRIMGYENKEQLGEMKLEVRVHPDDIAHAQADLERVLKGEFVISEYRQQTYQGNYLWVQISRNPVIDEESGRVIAFYAAARDITAQKEAEIALRESETRYRKVTESISDYAFSNRVNEDKSLELEWITPSFYRMMGYDHDDEPEQQKFQSQVHPDDYEHAMADLERVLQGEFVVSEYRQSKKSGEYVWLQMSRDPIWDDKAGRVIAYYGAARDITAQKEAEIALRDSELRYRKTTEIISDYAFSIRVSEDKSLVLEWITPSYFRLMGFESKDEVMSLTLESEVHPGDYEQAQYDLDRVLNGESVTTEYRQRTKTGNYIWLQMSRDPVWDEKGERVIAYYGAARDITAQKEAEIALRENEDRYRKISQIVSDFAYEVSIEADGTMKALWVLGPFEEVVGFSPDSISHINKVGTSAHPDDKEAVRADVERTMRNQRTISIYRIPKDNAYRWIRVTRTPTWNPIEERVDRILTAVSDVTTEKEAEAIIQETEKRYAAVSRIMSDFAYSLRILPDGSLEDEWLLGSFEEVVGLSQGEFSIARGWDDVTYPEDVIRVNTDIDKTAEGIPTVTEYRVINQKTRAIHWIRVTREPILDENGQVGRILGATKDITQEKEAQAALIQSEERYRLLTEVMSDYVFSFKVTEDGNLESEWLVGSFEQITGLPIDTSNFGPNSERTTHPEDAGWVQAELERTITGTKTVSEYRIINAANQQIRWVQVTRFPIWDEAHQRVIRILGAAKDITPQKEADAALRYSEERYRMLTTLMTDYAFSMRLEEDGNLYREWVVGSFEEITGIPIHALPPMNRIGQTTFEEDEAKLQDDIERTKQGETTITEYRIVNAVNNEIRWIRVTRHPIWNAEHSRVVQFIGAAKDITAEKEAQQAAHEADLLRQDLLRQKDLHELRSRFVSMVTHEFRNPLAAIQSSASILEQYLERLSEDKRQEKFINIYRQIERLTNLLEDLLGVGELENKSYQFNPQRIDILVVVRDLLDEFRESIGKAHHLVLSTPHDKVTSAADYQLLHRAFGNIISNAIKYSPMDSTVTCKVNIVDEEIILRISDEGMGIPESDFEKLFEAFFRASNVGSKPGTGLGLIIAQQAIEIHKGKIRFESKLGHGTTFIISFPRVIGTDSD